MDADLVGLGLGLGLCLAVAGTGLGASNAGRGNALASSRGGRRGGRGRGTPSGFRASSSLGGARDGGRPSRFNQVLLRSVVWFGGATERHYHNRGNGAGRAPAEAGGPLFRKHWLAAFGRALRRSQLQSQVAVASRSGCCCLLRPGFFFFLPLRCCTASSAVRTQPGQAGAQRFELPNPSPESGEQARPDQTRPRQGEARRGKAGRGKAGQGRAARLEAGPGMAVVTVLSLARSSLALTRREIRAQRDRRDLDGVLCVRAREA